MEPETLPDPKPLQFAFRGEKLTEVPTIDHKGETIKLGLALPDTYPEKPQKLTALPGYRRWTRVEIEDTLRKPREDRRKRFNAPEWWPNQNPYGSCAACSGVMMLRRLAHLLGIPYPELNWEFVYALVNRGSDNGALLNDVYETLLAIGACPLDLAKHPRGHIYKKYYTPEDYAQASAFKLETCFDIDVEEDLLTLLLSGIGQCVVAVHVDNDFMQIGRDGINGSANGPGNHSIILQDVSPKIVNGEIVYINPGSWGRNMSDEGYFHLTWNRHLKQPNQHHSAYGGLQVKLYTPPGEKPAPVAVA